MPAGTRAKPYKRDSSGVAPASPQLAYHALLAEQALAGKVPARTAEASNQASLDRVVAGCEDGRRRSVEISAGGRSPPLAFSEGRRGGAEG